LTTSKKRGVTASRGKGGKTGSSSSLAYSGEGRRAYQNRKNTNSPEHSTFTAGKLVDKYLKMELGQEKNRDTVEGRGTLLKKGKGDKKKKKKRGGGGGGGKKER